MAISILVPNRHNYLHALQCVRMGKVSTDHMSGMTSKF